MSPRASLQNADDAWQPHPDDRDDVAAALEAAERGDLLSADASSAFLSWLEGSEDVSWRAESE